MNFIWSELGRVRNQVVLRGSEPDPIRSRLFLEGLVWIRIRVNSTLLVLDVIIKTESKDFLFLKHKRLEIIHRNKGRHIANKT